MSQTLLNPRHLAALGVCAVSVYARARDYNTTPHNTTVTKFTFDDLT